MWTGKVSPFIRPKAKGTRPKRNLEKRLARRVVKPGYPVEPRAMTGDEIKAYFSGDSICCLLCGKNYRSLGLHLSRVHSVSDEEYREMYGLPWGRGLTCHETYEAYSESSKTEEKRAHMRAIAHEHRHLALSAIRENGVRSSPAARQANTDRILSAAGVRRLTDADFDSFIDAILTGSMPPKEVLKLNGMPRASALRQKVRTDAAFRAKYAAAVESLPFEVQAKHHILDERFKAEVIRLFQEGLSDKEIGARLGVTAMTCNAITKPLRRS